MSMQDGYHLNVARVTKKHAWDSTPQEPRFVIEHFCAIYLGRDEDAKAKAAELRAIFPAGEFALSLTRWQTVGKEQEIPTWG